MGSMTRPVLLVVVMVVAGVLYLLLRRRGDRGREEIKPLPTMEPAGTTQEEPVLRPFRPAAKAGATGSLPPRPRPAADDSGSSHPAYPVAPAKYSGAAPVKAGSSGRYEAYGGGPVSRPELDPVAEARGSAHAPVEAKPWYPEAPASYTEGEEPGDEGRGKE